MFLVIDNKRFEIKKANTIFKRFLGFMGKKNFNYGLFFKHTNSIHTFFMKENIDVVGINNHYEVIYKAQNLPKNKIIKINNKIKNTSIIELPSNASKKLKIGDKLTFVSK